MTVQAYRDRVFAKKRGDILDAAVAIFLRDGYERASMDDIARKAKVSTATLYKHAESKSALFSSILARAWNVGDSANDNDLRQSLKAKPESALTALGDHYAKSLTDPKVVALFRTMIGECQRFPELGEDLYNRAKLPYLLRVERYLEDQSSLGTLHVKDPKSATRQLLGMINDQVFWPAFLIKDFKVSDTHRRRIVAEAVQTFLARYGVSPSR